MQYFRSREVYEYFRKKQVCVVAPPMLERMREPWALRRLNILFVENDVHLHERMQLTLGDGFFVRGVSSVTEAKMMLDHFLPDILISEVIVGQESGLDLCRYVRSLSTLRYVPIML